MIVFYTSGHGFGHASRDIEVINALARRGAFRGAAPSDDCRAGLQSCDTRIHVRTSAPRWLFDLTAVPSIEFTPLECDTGIVQIDSLHLDEAASIRRADAFHAELDERAGREAEFLRASRARLVVGDIPPLAFAAAARAGLTSYALGNFSWDWIYGGYPEHLESAPSLLPRIRDAYSQAGLALRLPLHGGFAPFPNVVDVPFIARHARHSSNDVRVALGLPDHLPLVLMSFGGYGLESLDLAALGRRLEVGLVTTITDREAPLVQQEGATLLWTIGEKELYRSGLRYEDLVGAVDIVATKPGYGIVAECVANGTAVLYTSRGRFIEYDVLVREMPRYVRCAFISNEDLSAGRWQTALEQIFGQSAPRERPRTDGADVVADILVAALDGG